MTLYQFNEFSDLEQAEAVWEGTLLGHRSDGCYRVLLYQIDSFYVEVYYHTTANTILRFHSFSTTRLLDPYLHQINISEIFK
jgi:hypothetical protein